MGFGSLVRQLVDNYSIYTVNHLVAQWQSSTGRAQKGSNEVKSEKREGSKLVSVNKVVQKALIKKLEI